MAVNMDETIPMARVMANPLIGPVPIPYRTMAAINVVMFASAMVENAFS